jgi:hypothetical protein
VIVPIGAISIESNGSDFNRIGPNTRSKASQTSILLEEAIKKVSPLPASFDVAPIQQHYFSEFAYYDFFGGLLLGTMSSEITAMLIENSFLEAKEDRQVLSAFQEKVHDKYELDDICIKKGAEVIFLPGSNLIHAVNREIIDREILRNDKLLIKPHPLTQDDTLRLLGINYGYGRILPPKSSGLAVLKAASKVYVSSNSEIGLAATALGTPIIDITTSRMQPQLAYSAIYRLFKDGDVAWNQQVLCKLLSSKTSGLLMPWFSDVDDRAQLYFNSAMHLRRCYKPMYASTAYKFELQQRANTHVVRKD